MIVPNPEVPQPEPMPGAAQTDPVRPPADHRRRNWLIVGAVLLAGALCGVICLLMAGSSMFNLAGNKDDAQKVIETFMTDMAARDSDKAYQLFSTRAQRHVKKSDVDAMLDGNNYALFDGYQSLSVEGLQITAAMNTNPDLPQGSVATVSGTISYSGGFTGHFNAVLEQENGKWLLFNINVTVPPSKIQKGTST